jgi:hypothetical protein
MTLKEFNEKTVATKTSFVKPAIVCNDGYSFSCQGSYYHYCAPKEDVSEYTEMELGGWDLEDIDRYDSGGIAAYVPVELIQKMIDTHGGINEEKTFNRI